ncbi:hypothetical protein CAPTEDRAFT_206728 [Capitella teleta]|uniref:Chitin-binding type-2 domain-containing protein n=1 Tax=Capitella teleta TaxID=283909 RepID=R7TUV5_CAPTE|nr:hypothetical protein CAPTEDRAFT_206728 [Capitella teleta]|eukprot:ELT97693.1 hypothetical protein CAPTEDRAFT_206728 [Capitella teleta]
MCTLILIPIDTTEGYSDEAFESASSNSHCRSNDQQEIPNNSKTYLQCVNGHFKTISCPEGTYYCPVMKDCCLKDSGSPIGAAPEAKMLKNMLKKFMKNKNKGIEAKEADKTILQFPLRNPWAIGYQATPSHQISTTVRPPVLNKPTGRRVQIPWYFWQQRDDNQNSIQGPQGGYGGQMPHTGSSGHLNIAKPATSSASGSAPQNFDDNEVSFIYALVPAEHDSQQQTYFSQQIASQPRSTFPHIYLPFHQTHNSKLPTPNVYHANAAPSNGKFDQVPPSQNSNQLNHDMHQFNSDGYQTNSDDNRLNYLSNQNDYQSISYSPKQVLTNSIQTRYGDEQNYQPSNDYPSSKSRSFNSYPDKGYAHRSVDDQGSESNQYSPWQREYQIDYSSNQNSPNGFDRNDLSTRHDRLSPNAFQDLSPGSYDANQNADQTHIPYNPLQATIQTSYPRDQKSPHNPSTGRTVYRSFHNSLYSNPSNSNSNAQWHPSPTFGVYPWQQATSKPPKQKLIKLAVLKPTPQNLLSHQSPLNPHNKYPGYKGSAPSPAIYNGVAPLNLPWLRPISGNKADSVPLDTSLDGTKAKNVKITISLGQHK